MKQHTKLDASVFNSRPDWGPFLVLPEGERSPPPRAIHTHEGVTDRLRAAAFAELQAIKGFLWAAERFEGEAPAAALTVWRELAAAELVHLNWLLERLAELGEEPAGRPVSTQLWQSYLACRTAPEFARYMATAEDRGRQAGERFFRDLEGRDLVTAQIFRKIAEDEREHVISAARLFPETIAEIAARESRL